MRRTNEAAVLAAVDNVDVRLPTQDLLVLVGPDRDPRNALRLPFREATVLDANADLATTGRTFDVVIVECGPIDLARLDDLLHRKLLPVVRPDGRVLVALDDIGASPVPPGLDGPEPKLPGLDAVEWVGVSVVNGRPFAVVGRGIGPRNSAARPVAAAIAALAATHRLSATPLRDGARPRPELTDPMVMRQLIDHRRREQALRERLEAVTAALKGRRRSGWLRRLRRVVGRSRLGGVLRRVRTFARSAAGRS
jgi:hypothetical protein